MPKMHVGYHGNPPLGHLSGNCLQGFNKVIGKHQLKGALDKIFLWLNFIYHVECDCLFTNTKIKIQKFHLKVKKSSIFVNMLLVGIRLIYIHVAV